MFAFFSVIFAVSLIAEEKTLASGSFHSGGYGGPVLKVGLVNGEIGLFSGGRGGWIINHTFVVGGGSYTLMAEVETDGPSPDQKKMYLDLEYGGLELEYIHNSDEILHWTIHATLGGGAVRLMEHDPREKIEDDGLFIFEPSFNCDVNVFPWFRLGFGASYRLAFGVNIPGIDNSDISGPSGGITFKFGSF